MPGEAAGTAALSREEGGIHWGWALALCTPSLVAPQGIPLLVVVRVLSPQSHRSSRFRLRRRWLGPAALCLRRGRHEIAVRHLPVPGHSAFSWLASSRAIPVGCPPHVIPGASKEPQRSVPCAQPAPSPTWHLPGSLRTAAGLQPAEHKVGAPGLRQAEFPSRSLPKHGHHPWSKARAPGAPAWERVGAP